MLKEKFLSFNYLLFFLTGLCPDWQDWSPEDALQNAKEAMDLADNWLDVKQVSEK